MIHELNVKSHFLKSQGRQIIITTQDDVANLDYNHDEYGNDNKQSINENNNKIISYMDNIDTMPDYYYSSGSIIAKEHS